MNYQTKQAVRKSYKQLKNQKLVAEKFGIAQGTVSKIVNEKSLKSSTKEKKVGKKTKAKQQPKKQSKPKTTKINVKDDSSGLHSVNVCYKKCEKKCEDDKFIIHTDEPVRPQSNDLKDIDQRSTWERIADKILAMIGLK